MSFQQWFLKMSIDPCTQQNRDDGRLSFIDHKSSFESGNEPWLFNLFEQGNLFCALAQFAWDGLCFALQWNTFSCCKYWVRNANEKACAWNVFRKYKSLISALKCFHTFLGVYSWLHGTIRSKPFLEANSRKWQLRLCYSFYKHERT